MNEKEVWIIIPTLNPDECFVGYVKKLIEIGFSHILIVDDGSEVHYSNIFDELSMLDEVKILKHYINLGKGRALKDAFNYFLLYSSEATIGVITVDSDGQHLPEDVKRIAEELISKKDGLILGVRDFDKINVPFKSSFGNKMTTKVMKIFMGKHLKDTQTGLRGIPKKLCVEYMELLGERFEYEINMLIKTIEKKIPIYEIEIETIYINGNSETHFRPVKDSILIYGQILKSFFKFSIISILSFVIDISIFQIFLGITTYNGKEISGIWIATIGARFISSLFNFFMNKNIVFQSENSVKKSVIQYYALCLGIMLLSGGLVSILFLLLRWNKIVIKIIVDVILFLLSFQIQKQYIFQER